jgi:signal transduction histidine kinase
VQRYEGLGLRGIEERVNELHGQMRITSLPGGGATLCIDLPLPVDERREQLARAAG